MRFDLATVQYSDAGHPYIGVLKGCVVGLVVVQARSPIVDILWGWGGGRC